MPEPNRLVQTGAAELKLRAGTKPPDANTGTAELKLRAGTKPPGTNGRGGGGAEAP